MSKKRVPLIEAVLMPARRTFAKINRDAGTVLVDVKDPLDAERPKRIISGTVAEGRYIVTAGTISRHVVSGDLKDYRQTVHASNAPLRVDEDEIAARWNRRPQKRAPAK